MKSWFLLVGAITLEVMGSLSLKAALSNPLFYVVVVIGYAGALVLLQYVLHSGLSLGVAYGMWGAFGVALTAILSWLIFGENFNLQMGIGIAVIIAGVLCIELGSKHGRDDVPTAREA